MNKYSYFICPDCGSVTVSSSQKTEVVCCGKPLQLLQITPVDGDVLPTRTDGDEIIITLNHPMAKDNYIAFIALETPWGVFLRKLYPEWDEEITLPNMKGRVVWATSRGVAYSKGTR